MRFKITILIVGMVLTGCIIDRGSYVPAPRPMTAAESASAMVDEAMVQTMIARFGPLIYLRSDDAYVLDDPDYVLDNGVTLNWGLVENETDYNSFKATRVRTMPTSSATILRDWTTIKEGIESTDNPEAYRYWLHIPDKLKSGSMRRARALVHVLPADSMSTEIQFWLFYPFNGPGRVEVCASSKMCDDNWLREAGRHYGDWEMVSVLVSNDARDLLGVYMSRHNTSETFDRWEDGSFRSTTNSNNKLSFEGLGRNSHPIVYAGISSHAHYTTPGTHNYKRVFSKDYGVGTASADLFDRTDVGRGLLAHKPAGYRIIASDLPDFQVEEPDWLQYDGRWGQYERSTDKIKWALHFIKVYTFSEVSRGPTGPKAKTAWSGVF
ncbi:MAG: Vps62-related protein [Acidobacteria bacterium]|uniref:Vps62-related protein n=1 Tax=Candidatus Polarisedimenticola svalbardensis TaxID=2886004 RepID=A0A8J6Y3J5_9BACT|nr:Vps62-related protein [Candidatus Polarisedimenticola svalbardensis]